MEAVPKPPARIADVAARAGVGIATVSRVVNDRGNVAAATRDRVLEAIRALEYRPSSVAQNLSLKRTLVIGVVLPFLTEASPMTHIDAIRAPLFIQHGRDDPRVPVSESEHIHAVLSEKGIPSELLIFEDEGHTVEKLPNRIETFTRMTEFLDRVLAV